VCLGELLNAIGAAPDQDRIGHHPVAVLERPPPWSRIAQIERIKCWFMPCAR